MDRKHRRMILYRRVSSSEQADKGWSLPDQLRDCRQYADAQGASAIEGDDEGVFAEDFTGAAQIADRPVGSRVVSMLRRGGADGIIVHRASRLSRDLVDALVFIRDTIREGLEIHICDYGQVQDETDIRLLIEFWDADKERKRINDRTSRGRAAKARSGRVVGNGIFPYGYRKTGSGRTADIAVNDAEAQIVRTIFVWYVRGDGDRGPMSLSAIAKELTDREIETPGASRAHRKIRTRPACAWDYCTVSYILENTIYIGQWRWAGAAIPVPALVSRPLWDEAQKRREFNREVSRHNKSRQYLLSGMIKCGCGRAMVGTSSPVAGNDRVYYQCTDVKRKYKGIEARCDQRQVRADVIESVVWEYVLDLLTDPSRFEEELRRAQATELDVMKPKRERLAVVDGMVAEAEAEAGKLAQALVKADGAVGDALQRQMDDMNGRHARLTRERDRLLSEIEAGALTNAQIEQAMNYRHDVVMGLQNATSKDKRDMFELLAVEATVRGNVATVRCRVPARAEPREIDLNSTSSLQLDSLGWVALQSSPVDLSLWTVV